MEGILIYFSLSPSLSLTFVLFALTLRTVVGSLGVGVALVLNASNIVAESVGVLKNCSFSFSLLDSALEMKAEV